MTVHYRKGFGIFMIIVGLLNFLPFLISINIGSGTGMLNLFSSLIFIVLGFISLNGIVVIFDKQAKTMTFKALIGTAARTIHYEAASFENGRVYFVIDGKKKRYFPLKGLYISKKEWDAFVNEIKSV